MRARLDTESLVKANSQFWEQMLNMHLEPLPEGQTFCVDPGHILGQVHLSGNWKGRIEVRLTEGLALAATSAMLMQPLEEVGEADTLDAIREIANMVAGTIKSALPRPCSMTVPESAVASEGLCNLPTSDDTLAVAFSHESGSLMVRVWEEECAEPSAIEDTPE